MGFSYHGGCYPTYTDAVAAFVLGFPDIDTGGQLVLNSYTMNEPASSVSYNATLRYWDGGQDTRNASYTFYTCTGDSDMSLSEVFAIPSAADMSSAWGIGFSLPFALALLVWGIRRVTSLLDPNHRG